LKELSCLLFSTSRYFTTAQQTQLLFIVNVIY
jgi:hypothetical protein